MTAELVPVSNPDEIAALPPKERGEMITAALHESKTWLAIATKGTDPTPVAEFKAWAATVAEMTRQKGLASEIQLDAQEMVRRAERGIGLTIRNGQSEGSITRSGERSDRTAFREAKTSPSEWLRPGDEMSQTYDLTDDVTDEQFEDALETARKEGNVSRANTIRKVRGQPTKTVKSPAPAPVGNSVRPDGGPITSRHKNRHHYIRAEQVHTAIANLDALLTAIDGATEGLDPSVTSREAAQLLDGLSRSGGAYRRLRSLLSQRKDGTA